MKNRFFLTLVAFVFISNSLIGQTGHYKIETPDSEIRSTITVSNKNTLSSYVVGVYKGGYLFVEKLNNNFPQQFITPTVNSFKVANNSYKIFLTGGFFDEDDNIVVYGYTGINKNGVIVKINMETDIANSIRYTISNKPNTPVYDGCYSKAGMFKTYDFIVSDNIFMRIPADFTSNSPQCIVKKIPNAKNMSVSWDDVNKKHVISGCKSPTGTEPFRVFIGTLNGTIGISNIPTSYTFSPNDFSSYLNTNKHILSGNGYYSDGIAYMVQDLRKPLNVFDALWVLKINYLTGQVLGSNAYFFKSDKMQVIDVAHNFNSLFVLGHCNTYDSNNSSHFTGRYLSQINLYDSTDFIIKKMTDVNLYGSQLPTNYVTREAYLSNITYNHYTSFVQASGSIDPIGTIGTMMETFDMSNSLCDDTITANLEKINYTNLTESFSFQPLNINGVWATNASNNILSYLVTISGTDDFYMYNSCISLSKSDSYFHKHKQIQQAIKEKQNLYEVQSEQLKSRGEIIVMNNKQFICNDFQGVCNYKVFDLYGRLMLEGITENGNYNDLNIVTSGVYLIRVKDSNNNIKTEKIVISE